MGRTRGGTRVPPLDLRTEVGTDARDPRAEGWPCHGKHTEGENSITHANQYGETVECSRCAVTLKYTARVGYTGAYRKASTNPTVVTQAQSELQHLGEAGVTNKIFRGKIAELQGRRMQKGAPNRQERHAQATAQTPTASEADPSPCRDPGACGEPRGGLDDRCAAGPEAAVSAEVSKKCVSSLRSEAEEGERGRRRAARRRGGGDKGWVRVKLAEEVSEEDSLC